MSNKSSTARHAGGTSKKQMKLRSKKHVTGSSKNKLARKRVFMSASPCPQGNERRMRREPTTTDESMPSGPLIALLFGGTGFSPVLLLWAGRRSGGIEDPFSPWHTAPCPSHA